METVAKTGDRITKRTDGRYMARYSVHTADGPKRKTIYGKRYADVAEKLTKAMADRDGGLVYDAGKITVGEYLAAWLADSVRDTVRQRTYERYESLVRVHIVPTLGRVKLKSLTPAHVRGLYRSKLDAGLSARSVLHLHRTLSKALKQATDDGLIPRNAAPPPSSRPSRAERRYSRSPANRSARSWRPSPATVSKPSTSSPSPPDSGAASY